MSASPEEIETNNSAEGENSPSSSAETIDNRWLYFAIAATIIGLIFLVVFAVLLITGWQLGGDNDRVEGGETPTPALTQPGFPTPLPTMAPAVYFDVALNPSTVISVPVTAPMALEIAGRRYQIQIERVPVDGAWSPQIPNENSAAWIYGTVVNYVIGLPDSAGNRALIDSLSPGDEITVINGDGSSNQYSFDRRDVVEAASSGIFAQTTPGITLALVGTAQTSLRLMAHGNFVVPETNSSSGSSIELNEPAQLEDWVITVNSSSFLYDRPEAPAGFAFYLIDYAIQNSGQQILDASMLNFILVDGFGNQYALNPLATQFGNYPLAQGPLPAGQTRSATVGFQIPASLNSGSLTLLISSPPGSGVLEVSLPFNSVDANAQNAVVSLSQAEVSLDGASLTLSGQVTNLGTQPLIIEENDLILQSGSAIYLLFSTNPGLPWVVGAGQTSPFVLQYQRPNESDAIFTVLSYPFQLIGLR